MEFHKSTTKIFLIKGGIKHILKESFKEYFPKILNKSKKGFGVPVGNG
jgi:hypothetical protein